MADLAERLRRRKLIEGIDRQHKRQKMTLKPFHEHELEPQDCSCCDTPTINWYCLTCRRAIEGPPWAIGDYVVTSAYRVKLGRVWQVHMRASWAKGWHDGPLAVFESTRERDALKHARMLERGRLRLLRMIEEGDAKLLADIHRDVKRVEREERDT